MEWNKAIKQGVEFMSKDEFRVKLIEKMNENKEESTFFAYFALILA